MPPVAVLLTIVSMVPFVACGLAAAGPHAEPADRMLAALIGYAALMLAFAGGLYWAMILLARDRPAPVGVRPILTGAVPVLLAWAALVVAYEFPGWIALPILIFGYVAAVLAELHAGLMADQPRAYVWLRWGFTGVAVAMLTTVLMLRVTGSTIAF